MSWKVVVRPEVEMDISEAAEWYDSRRAGLGAEFKIEVLRIFDDLMESPFVNSRRHPNKDIRWRYPERFPYRVIYEVIETEKTVVIAAVLHAARHDRNWLKRIRG